jgi:hypothetical protein
VLGRGVRVFSNAVGPGRALVEASHRFFVRARARNEVEGGERPQLEGLIDVSSVVLSEKEDL